MRVFYDKIDMRLFVDVVEEWKGSGENKNANRSHCAEANDEPAHRAFGQFHLGDSDAKRCSITVSVPCSVIRGGTPPFCARVVSISGRYGEFVSTTNTVRS